MNGVRTVLIWVGPLLWTLPLIVLCWPRRRQRRFTVNCFIAAPRAVVWSHYRIKPDHPITSALQSQVVASRQLAGNPGLEETVVDVSGGAHSQVTTLRYLTLIEQPDELHSYRLHSVDDRLAPFGPSHSDTVRFQERSDGTFVSLEWQGETVTLWQLLAMRRAMATFLRRLKSVSETGTVAPSGASKRPLWISLALTITAIAGFAILFGWIVGLLLSAILILHEFGHWLAMRITGQPAPRMMLIPFLGGLATANHPHKTLFDEAFCSLMGAGFSALFVVGFMAAASFLGLPQSGVKLADLLSFENARGNAPLLLACLAGLIGLVNVLQMVPVLPLDGGQVLHALMQSFSTRWARIVSFAVAGLGLALVPLHGDVVVASIFCLGALQAWHMKGQATGARVISGVGIGVIASAFALTTAIHLWAVLYVTHLLNIEHLFF